MAYEVPAKRAAVELVLRGQILRAVLSDDLDPCIGELRELRDGDVLRCDDHGDAGSDFLPDALVALADLLRRRRR